MIYTDVVCALEEEAFYAPADSLVLRKHLSIQALKFPDTWVDIYIFMVILNNDDELNFAWAEGFQRYLRIDKYDDEVLEYDSKMGMYRCNENYSRIRKEWLSN